MINDGNSFAKEIDLRTNINCILRVTSTFNLHNGVAYWHFISLDPVTRDITEDPMQASCLRMSISPRAKLDVVQSGKKFTL